MDGGVADTACYYTGRFTAGAGEGVTLPPTVTFERTPIHAKSPRTFGAKPKVRSTAKVRSRESLFCIVDRMTVSRCVKNTVIDACR